MARDRKNIGYESFAYFFEVLEKVNALFVFPEIKNILKSIDFLKIKRTKIIPKKKNGLL